MRIYWIILLSISFSFARAQTVALAADSLYELPGSQVLVPVRALGFSDLISFQGTMAWDTSILRLDSVVQFGLAGLNQNSFGLNLAVDGLLPFSWDDASFQGINLPDSSVLFQLSFSLTGSMGNCSLVEFIQNPTPLEFVNTSFNTLPYQVYNGAVCIVDTTPLGFAWEKEELNWAFIFPNPLNEKSVLKLDLDSGEEIRLLVFDGKGSLCWENRIRKNKNLAFLRLGNVLSESLPTGIYTMWVQAGNRSSRLKFTIEQTK